jgi:hypothetical protein
MFGTRIRLPAHGLGHEYVLLETGLVALGAKMQHSGEGASIVGKKGLIFSISVIQRVDIVKEKTITLFNLYRSLSLCSFLEHTSHFPINEINP